MQNRAAPPGQHAVPAWLRPAPRRLQRYRPRSPADPVAPSPFPQASGPAPLPAGFRGRPEVLRSFEPHPKRRAASQSRQVALAKASQIFLAFEQVVLRLAAVEEV